jgi:hypothetical protein
VSAEREVPRLGVMFALAVLLLLVIDPNQNRRELGE